MRDYEQDFSRKQEVNATAVSDNTVKVPAGDIGRGRPVILQVDAAAYIGAGNIVVNVETDNDASMANAEVCATYPLSEERLKKGGTVLAAALPTGVKEYLRLGYVLSGTLSGGSLTAGLKLNGDTAAM